MFGEVTESDSERTISPPQPWEAAPSDLTSAEDPESDTESLSSETQAKRSAKSQRRRNPARASSLPPKRRSESIAAARRHLDADRAALRANLEREPIETASAPVGKGPSAAFASLASANTKASSIVVLGASKSGKTLLTQTFCSGMAQLRPAPTMGVERNDVTNHLGDLRVWDTSGDARFEEATLALVRNATAIVVTYARSNAASFDFAAARLIQAKCDAPDGAVLALVATALFGRAAANADTTCVELDRRARRIASTCHAVFHVVTPTDRIEVDALFGEICDVARKDREIAAEAEKSQAAEKQNKRLAFERGAKRDADELELFCYGLAFFVVVVLSFSN